MLGFGLAGKIIAGSAVALTLLSGAFYVYVQWSQKERAELRELVEAEQLARKTIQQSISTLKDQVQKGKDNMEIIQRESQEIREQARELEAMLARHNLENLASERPGLIQSRANRATDEVFRELEEITDPSWQPEE